MARELLRCNGTTPDSDSTIMDAFSPELAEHWLAGQAMSADERPGSRGEDSLSPAQQEAWEELAERVNAARSVY
jgi:hypothetical protein